MSEDGFSGGCFCGAVRYRSDAPARTICLCHCAMCRHSVGAHAVAWATVPRASLTITAGRPAWHRSSAKARRGFCAQCGTSLFFESEDWPDEIDLTVASADHAQGLAPTWHAWARKRLPWTGRLSDLPAHAAGSGSPRLGAP
jgi:hypothetical protein